MSLNTHPTKSDHHNHHHDNLLFSTEEMQQVDRSVAHNKLLKIVALLVIVIGITTVGLYYSHTSHQSPVDSITTSSSANKSTDNPLVDTTPNNNSIDSTTTLQAKAAAEQAKADKLAAQAKQYIDTGNNDLANALKQQAAEQQAIADQAAQYAADSAKIKSLQEQQQAASAAQQQAIAQQQAALQQCQQQKSAADAPKVSEINQLQTQITTLIAQIAGVPQKVQAQFAGYGGTASAIANAIASQTAVYNQQLNSLQNQLTSLQSQLNTINRQYSC